MYTDTSKQRTAYDVTYAVTTTGNMPALQMSLTTVLMGSILPSRIVIRFEGEFPSFGTFYMEQITELARIKGIDVSMTVSRSEGVRAARKWLVDECRTKFLWMGDDDVMYSPHCLAAFTEAVSLYIEEEEDTALQHLAYINGNKPDLNNRRGYEDFSTKPIASETVADNSGYNAFFAGDNRLVRCSTADTGNLFIHVTNIRNSKIDFQAVEKEWNSSGDDTVFALKCHVAGLKGFFSTRADSYHMEKPNVRFNEFAARKNYLRLVCEKFGVPASYLNNMLPWLR